MAFLLFQSVSVTPPNDAINVEFRGPVKLPSDVLQATPVAFISFTGTYLFRNSLRILSLKDS